MNITECSDNLDPEEFNDDGSVIVTRYSPFSGKFHKAIIKATRKQFDSWANGKLLLQHAFPNLTADEREFIKTGITPQEWDEEFKIAEE